jgi:hypothetical protein
LELENAEVNLECVNLVLENLEAKFDGKPMSWKKAAMKKKKELVE